MRLRKGRIFAVRGDCRSKIGGAGWADGVAADLALVWARMRSKSAVEGSGRGVREHLKPSCAAAGIGEHIAAGRAAEDVEVEGGLIGGRERAVEHVGQHVLALRAGHIACACFAGLDEVCHLIPPALLYVGVALQVPPRPRLMRLFTVSFGDFQDHGNLFIIHVLQVAQNDCLAEFGGDLAEGVLNASLKLQAGDVVLLGRAGVGEAVGRVGLSSSPSKLASSESVERSKRVAAEVVDEQVAGEGW